MLCRNKPIVFFSILWQVLLLWARHNVLGTCQCCGCGPWLLKPTGSKTQLHWRMNTVFTVYMIKQVLRPESQQFVQSSPVQSSPVQSSPVTCRTPSWACIPAAGRSDSLDLRCAERLERSEDDWNISTVSALWPNTILPSSDTKSAMLWLLNPSTASTTFCRALDPENVSCILSSVNKYIGKKERLHF